VEAVLRQDYDLLQVILAYNTPEDLPVEDELRAIAERDPRFTAVRIQGSVSKAQNVNAVLKHVTGEFVAVFDADHHPAPGSFKRAWRWLAKDADVVQGHCVVRNGTDGTLQRLIAAEFEAMYAVSHPGRARLHGFGIFGGSNGYWRTSVLRLTRLRSFMLTEDIDSSMRVIGAGGRIVSDPGLLSSELAPGSWSALWGQRLRWAQGWSQVSLRYLGDAWRNRQLSLRQKAGLTYLLGWREVYPWISLQTFPILAFWFLRGEPPVSWFVPAFVATTLFTFSAGVVQAWTAWRLSAPELRRRGRWFVFYGLLSQLFYVEFKNVVTRTAHLKEGMRERRWKVTPRSNRLGTPVKPVR
jgi:cellulose synthase/poly-beta-1,6-N-acetylglucosamine synthase-like glycosyltransferase